MTVRYLAWYLCVLFLFALAVESAVTFVPDRETFGHLLLGIWTALAAIFAMVAITASWFQISGPKWLLRGLQIFAVVGTLAVVLLTVG